MNNYTMPKQLANKDECEVETLTAGKPSLRAFIVVIQDLKGTLEPKPVTIGVTLLRQDFKKISKKVTAAESHINLLQSTTKKVESQVQLLTKQSAAMAQGSEWQSKEEQHKGYGDPIRG
ncbi:hypothetical protein NDU88_004546 [Pleurodeles waltl]|uniref:Uncharacterized protein n=1 Tax=Pleurodeles waltl TaxID=8319 RepID=A0AAV7VJK6_PLEWA|nr:hypothetical protein NDU88_004546 [Pleurodeles waltl]